MICTKASLCDAAAGAAAAETARVRHLTVDGMLTLGCLIPSSLRGMRMADESGVLGRESCDPEGNPLPGARGVPEGVRATPIGVPNMQTPASTKREQHM